MQVTVTSPDAENMISESEHIRLNEKKWDKWAGTLDGKSRRNDFLRAGQAAVVSLLNLKENCTFLDVGCGTGWAVNLAARSVNDRGTFYGVDLSAKMVEKAEENFKGRTGFHFIRADSRSIPLESDSCDVIICTHSFHHYLAPMDVLKEMRRLLRTGGRVYILDPTTDIWISRVVDRSMKILQPDHVKMYSTNEFRRMFSDAELKYVRTEIVKSFDKIHIGEK